MIRAAFVGFVLAHFVGSAALAATVSGTFNYNLDGSNPAFPEPLVISEGDVVDITVHFNNNESVRLDNVGYRFWLDAGSNDSTFTISNIVVTFFDLSTNGTFVNGASQGSQSSGQAHLGWQATASALGLSAGEFLQFSGYNISYDVVALSGGTLDYEGLFVYPAFEGSVVSTVPVPASGILLISVMGLIGGIGLGTRRIRAGSAPLPATS